VWERIPGAEVAACGMTATASKPSNCSGGSDSEAAVVSATCPTVLAVLVGKRVPTLQKPGGLRGRASEAWRGTISQARGRVGMTGSNAVMLLYRASQV